MLKKIVLLTALVSQIFAFSSCKKNDSQNSITPALSSDEKSEIHLCTEKTLDDTHNGVNKRTDGALLISKKWVTGQTINIKFLNGDAFLQNKVKQYAAEWALFANLKFQYVGINDNADIKIGFKFNSDGGSWSYLGTDCKYIAQNAPSMNFGWLTNTTAETELHRVISHELGHALGLIHEHQNPTANIPWDKAKVYAYYAGAPNYWTAAQVDNNIFNKYSTTITNYSQFDLSSVMLYAIPSSLTTNGFSTQTNTSLSYGDRIFINQQYPFPKVGNILYPGQSLTQNQFLQSLDGRFRLVMQTDGNLVLYKNGTQAIWSSNTSGKPFITRCDMQIDGNLVLYNNSNTPYWASNTDRVFGNYLILQNDGNLVMYQYNTPKWESRTWMYN